jgi:hypothetical protein
MSGSTLRKLRGGCYAVTLALPPDIAEFALEGFRARGFESADAHLSCVLNSAMFDEMCAEREGEGSPYNGFFEKGDDDLPFRGAIKTQARALSLAAGTRAPQVAVHPRGVGCPKNDYKFRTRTCLLLVRKTYTNIGQE